MLSSFGTIGLRILFSIMTWLSSLLRHVVMFVLGKGPRPRDYGLVMCIRLVIHRGSAAGGRGCGNDVAFRPEAGAIFDSLTMCNEGYTLRRQQAGDHMSRRVCTVERWAVEVTRA